MINIPVDEGYAFDFLSILAVKIEKKPNEEITKCFKNTYEYIAKEILNKYLLNIYEILSSQEYQNLFLINKKLYELVDLAKNDSIKASEVDAYVYKRYLAKKALQEKFFPEQKLTEQKIGYK